VIPPGEILRKAPWLVLTGALRTVFAAIPRRRSERWVLIVCGGGHLADHLADFRRLFADDPRLRFRLLVPRQQRQPGSAARTRAALPLPEVSLLWASVFRWDLAVVADHHEPAVPKPHRCPVIRIQHGLPGKRVDGSVYAFGPGAFDHRGRLRYTKVLVSSDAVKRLAVECDPAFERAVEVVGNLGDDRLLAEVPNRARHRERLGFTPTDRVVLVFSTWGPNGLFHRFGDAILAQAESLRDEFRFILSAHRLDHAPGAPGERNWGEQVAAQASRGFWVRDPDEDWVPFLVACDVVLSDHTSVTTHAALIGRPVVHVPAAAGVLEPGSPVWQLHEVTPAIRPDAADLGEALRAALRDGPPPGLRDLAAQLNSHPGEAAERIREVTYDLLRLPPPPLAAPPEQA